MASHSPQSDFTAISTLPDNVCITTYNFTNDVKSASINEGLKLN